MNELLWDLGWVSAEIGATLTRSCLGTAGADDTFGAGFDKSASAEKGDALNSGLADSFLKEEDKSKCCCKSAAW